MCLLLNLLQIYNKFTNFWLFCLQKGESNGKMKLLKQFFGIILILYSQKDVILQPKKKKEFTFQSFTF